MFKKFFIFIVLSNYLVAQDQNYSKSDSKWLLGLGFQGIESSYKQMDDKKSAIPVIRYEGERFYWHTLEAGYKVSKEKDSSFAFAIKARLDSYESGDSTYLVGMEDRKRAVEFGIRKNSYLTKKDTISYSFFHDMAKKHKGYELAFQYKHRYMISNVKTMIFPYLKVEYLSDDLTGYYYGVKDSEKLSSRSSYDPSSAINLSIGININTKLSEKVMLMMGFDYKKLDGSITGSPIIDQSSQKKLITAIMYRY